MANMEKVNEVLNWIETHEVQWNQRAFALPLWLAEQQRVDICNSSYCMAGATMLLAKRVKVLGECLVPLYADGTNDEYADWEEEAAKVLGLNQNQAFCIFYCMTNDFAEFKEHVLWVVEHPNDVQEMHERKDAITYRYESGHRPDYSAL